MTASQDQRNIDRDHARVAQRFLLAGIVFAGMAVALGAFGAHALQGWLESEYTDPAVRARRIENWETGVRYQMYHAVGLMLLAISQRNRWSRWATLAGLCFAAGIVIFAGCLYGLVLTNITGLGMIVPLGGLGMLAGWALFAVSIFARPTPS